MSVPNCEPSKATGITVLQDPAHLQRKHSHKLKSAIPRFGKKGKNIVKLRPWWHLYSSTKDRWFIPYDDPQLTITVNIVILKNQERGYKI